MEPSKVIFPGVGELEFAISRPQTRAVEREVGGLIKPDGTNRLLEVDVQYVFAWYGIKDKTKITRQMIDSLHPLEMQTIFLAAILSEWSGKSPAELEVDAKAIMEKTKIQEQRDGNPQ